MSFFAGLSPALFCLLLTIPAASKAQAQDANWEANRRDEEAPRTLVARCSDTMRGNLTLLAAIKYIDLGLMRGAAIGFMQHEG
jgi:hypothetical protein